MKIHEIQNWLAGLIGGVSELSGIPIVPDDGLPSRRREREVALSAPVSPITKGGLCITIFPVEFNGIVSTVPSGHTAAELMLIVVVEENPTVNRGAHGFGIVAQEAAEYVLKRLLGKDWSHPADDPIKASQDPLPVFGYDNGVWRVGVVVNKQHRLTPI